MTARGRSAVSSTPPPSRAWNWSGPTCWRLIRARTRRSATSVRNSSRRSRARLGRPGRSACRKPTSGSRPAAARPDDAVARHQGVGEREQGVDPIERGPSRPAVHGEIRPAAGADEPGKGAEVDPRGVALVATDAVEARGRGEALDVPTDQRGREGERPTIARRRPTRGRPSAGWSARCEACRPRTTGPAAAQASGRSALRNCSRRTRTFPDRGAVDPRHEAARLAQERQADPTLLAERHGRRADHPPAEEGDPVEVVDRDLHLDGLLDLDDQIFGGRDAGTSQGS